MRLFLSFPKCQDRSSQEPVKAKMNAAYAAALTEPCLDLGTHLRKERNKAKTLKIFALEFAFQHRSSLRIGSTKMR
jgi:hypothetical protein